MRHAAAAVLLLAAPAFATPEIDAPWSAGRLAAADVPVSRAAFSAPRGAAARPVATLLDALAKGGARRAAEQVRAAYLEMPAVLGRAAAGEAARCLASGLCGAWVARFELSRAETDRARRTIDYVFQRRLGAAGRAQSCWITLRLSTAYSGDYVDSSAAASCDAGEFSPADDALPPSV